MLTGRILCATSCPIATAPRILEPRILLRKARQKFKEAIKRGSFPVSAIAADSVLKIVSIARNYAFVHAATVTSSRYT